MRRQFTTFLTAGALAISLAACGDSDDGSGSEGGSGYGADPAAKDTTDAATSDDVTGDDVMAGAPTVSIASTDLGEVLVDGEGMTLYLFTQDSPDTSVCEGDCLEAWPILEGEPTAGAGVDDSLLGSFEREDGTVQATYNDWPLYYFVQDSEPGDVTGQGVNDVWYVLTADGEMVTDAG